ncbi:MAG: acyltransferase family protein [Solirubrobacteraceae bacterium]
MAGIAAPTLQRVPALDGLRAIAVGGVLLFHGGVSAVPGGFLGVDVFFVLSGYLITSLLLTERAANGRISLPHFWMRRARRLLPAVVVLVIGVLLVSLFLASGERNSVRGDALSSLLYFNNWHQIFTDQSYFEAAGRPSLLRHLWSLSVEEQFYLLWPLALIAGLNAMRRLRFVQVVVGAAALSTILMAVLYDPSSDPSRVYYGTDTRLTPLLLGATFAFLWPMRSRETRSGPRAAAFLDGAAILGLVAVGAAFLGAHEYDTWIYRGGLAAIALATAVLISAVVHPASRVARPLGSAPFVWVGERSYGIYLWHWPVMALSRPEIDVSLTLWVLVPLQIGLTVALASASYRYVEMPFRRREAQARIRDWMGRRAPRQRLGVVTAGVLATILAFVWLGSGATAPPEKERVTGTAQAAVAPVRTRPKAPAGKLDPPLLVGASVMLGAQEALEDRLGKKIVVDAAVGRNPDDIAARLEAYKAEDALPNRVVVQAGENAPLREEDIERIHNALQGVRRVVFVNVHVPTTWEADVNNTLLALRGEWPEMVIANWDKVARRDLLYDDGIHPTPDGAKVYAQVIQDALRLPYDQ